MYDDLFHLRAKEYFVHKYYGNDIEVISTRNQQLKIDAAKIISKANNCNLNEILFVDDIDKNVINFNKIGMNAILPNEVDSLMSEAVKYVIEIGQASISKLQRRFGIGFSRAGKIIDQMERLRYISPADGSKPRTVYITMEEYIQIYGE